MNKWLVYALTLAAIPVLSFGGFGGRDVGKLRPVQLVMVRREGDRLRLTTDTGDSGRGTDIHKAIKDMKGSADAEIFLDTADYLLLGEGTEACLPQLQEYLRPSCALCRVTGEPDPEAVVTYLQQHPPELTLTQYEAAPEELPELVAAERRNKLVQ